MVGGAKGGRSKRADAGRLVVGENDVDVDEDGEQQIPKPGPMSK
jgi:hypothetical protein